MKKISPDYETNIYSDYMVMLSGHKGCNVLHSELSRSFNEPGVVLSCCCHRQLMDDVSG